MSFDAEGLWKLLPEYIRTRDTDLANPNGPDAQGNYKAGPLRELIELLASQTAVLEEDLEQLYDNFFVETAAPWALPYIGDLLGIHGVGGVGHTHHFAPRAEVANTIAYRRHKGTAAVLEQLARDATGWPAAVVEFFRRLATTQHLNHVRLSNRSWLSVRDANAMEFIGTPFEDAARTAEVRRIEPRRGKWNIPNVGIFLWRLQAYSRTQSPLTSVRLASDGTEIGVVRRFRFHPIGMDVPLCINPIAETEMSHLAAKENVPLLFTRRFLSGERLMQQPPNDEIPVEPPQFHPDTKFYGSDAENCLLLERFDDHEAIIPIRADEIIVCNLHDVFDTSDRSRIIGWGHESSIKEGKPLAGRILLDPERGRVVFPPNYISDGDTNIPLASFSFLFPADIGGGEYARVSSFVVDSTPTQTLSRSDINKNVDAHISPLPRNTEVIEIQDGDRYTWESPTAVNVGDRTIEIRGADEAWPVLQLNKSLQISGNENGFVRFNGLLIIGNPPDGTGSPSSEKPFVVQDKLRKLCVRHCTILPGLTVLPDGTISPTAPRPPAITVDSETCQVNIENCIVGPISVAHDVRVRLKNCIVDAGARGELALGGIKGDPGGEWRIENCTIIGRVNVRVLTLASNTIFWSSSVKVERLQEGCVRFCWLETNARVPRRYRCLPRNANDEKTGVSLADVRPMFTSLRYGEPGYCQLSQRCPESIRCGADDESEMGVYHDLFQPQREAHLRARLNEYLRFGLEAGIFFEPRLSNTSKPGGESGTKGATARATIIRSTPGRAVPKPKARKKVQRKRGSSSS